ncbi:MAG: phosphate acyltransferase, partial [Verrucomicrobiota bacterium]
ITECESEVSAAQAAAAYTRKGKADVLVKGCIPTSTLIRAVLSRERGIRADRLLSHVAVFNDPVSGRLMFLTDAGVNIAPNIYRKVRIVKNAVAVAKRLGCERPKVALLAAVDKLNYPAMPATLDAALVTKMAGSGMVSEADVEGPFALDNAMSKESADKKNKRGVVAGLADVLVAPEIETANVLYKALQFFSQATFASAVVGASSPIAVPSRVDSMTTKMMSIMLSCFLVRISHKIPVASAESATARARSGKTPDCSM